MARASKDADEVRWCAFCDTPILPGHAAVRRWEHGKLQPAEHAECGYSVMEQPDQENGAGIDPAAPSPGPGRP